MSTNQSKIKVVTDRNERKKVLSKNKM